MIWRWNGEQRANTEILDCKFAVQNDDVVGE